jgi:shikimate dehydrogenase
MHNAALQAAGLDGWSYKAISIPPEELPAAVAQLRKREFKGANVTIPHKEQVIPLLDRLTPAAQAIGAVNTIYKEEEELIGDNTDAPGFMADLKRLFAGNGQAIEPGGSIHSLLNKGKALVLGAGGSARAVVHALHEDDWQIILAARRIEQAQALAAAYPGGSVIPTLLNHLSLKTDQERTIGLVVNTTPAGMHPHIDTCPWPEDLPLPPGAFIYDLVYRPPLTALLVRARSEGLPNANGLGMLVEQAALSFERWTGKTAPRKVMFQAVQV